MEIIIIGIFLVAALGYIYHELTDSLYKSHTVIEVVIADMQLLQDKLKSGKLYE